MLQSLTHASPHLGQQRFWYWRGWRIRYTFLPAQEGGNERSPIVLIHGFGSSLNQWRDNLTALSQCHPVYALDLLGFGGSEKAATLFGTNIWSAQVLDFCRTFFDQPIILVGHSLGALVAITVANRQPSLVQRLVMITLPPARQDLVAGWVDTLSRSVESAVATPPFIRLIFQVARRPSFLRAVLRRIYLQPQRVDESLVNVFALPPQERGAARTLCYLVKSRTEEDFSPSTQVLVEGLTMPTLLVWGESDRVIPFKYGQELAQLNPLLTFQPIPEAGHCLYDEDPDGFNRLIYDWLASASGLPT